MAERHNCDPLERVALYLVETREVIVFARLHSGLYRIVGGNFGDWQHAFKRHDEKRAARAARMMAKKQVETMFSVGGRANLVEGHQGSHHA